MGSKAARARAIRAKLHHLQGGLCCYCEGEMDLHPGRRHDGPAIGNQTTLEHLTDRSKGGTNDPDNLAAACHDCNSRRARLGLSWVEFKTLVRGEQGIAQGERR